VFSSHKKGNSKNASGPYQKYLPNSSDLDKKEKEKKYPDAEKRSRILIRDLVVSILYDSSIPRRKREATRKHQGFLIEPRGTILGCNKERTQYIL